MKPWLRAVLRNLSLVSDESLASALRAPEEAVAEVRALIGAEDLPVEPLWRERGFVSIIRQNWDLLTEEQIRTLLSLSEKDYRALLADYDFLAVKLGEKPDVGTVLWSPPDEGDREELFAVRDFLKTHRRAHRVRPFDFFADGVRPCPLPEAQAIGERFLSSYSANFTGALEDDDLSDYSDEELERIRDSGVTGIWLHETLRNLTPFVFDESLSSGWERRLGNLRKLTGRAAAHGLHVYLYLNEPRSLPAAFFEKYPHLRGAACKNGDFCLCTSVPAVREYLYSAVRLLAERVPQLFAIMTITMSENPTHCYAKTKSGLLRPENCPRCARRAPEEIAAELNNTIAAALRDCGAKTRLIANLWGWSDFCGWSEDQILGGVDLLDPGIDVLCVSEYGKDFLRGGARGRVIDYSISVVGPSDVTVRTLRHAKEKGHRIWAKAQVNNSWECSAVPFLPAFGLMTEHIRALSELGLDGLMLGWSLGGYPGGALPLCNRVAADPAFDEEIFYRENYGEDADVIRSAVACFDRAFLHFPFSVDGIYLGGQTLGPANAVSASPQGRASTMVCFTFDDYERYVGPYGIDGYLSLYENLLSGWEEGLALLKDCRPVGESGKFLRAATGAYLHFLSAYHIARIAKYKRAPQSRERSAALKTSVLALKDAAERLYALVCEDATIGFEMSNQYYYTPNLLLERICELTALADTL